MNGSSILRHIVCAASAASAVLLATAPHAETLEQAFTIGLRADTRFTASARHVAAAQSKRAAAQGLGRPQVTVDALYYRLSDEPAFTVSISPLPTTTLPFAQDKGWLYRAGVTVPLYTAGRLTNIESAAQAGLDAARLDVQRTEQDIKLDVASAYISVLRAQRQLALADSGVQTLQAHERDATLFYERGLVARNDLLAANSAVANARQDRIRAATALEIARSAYNRQLGRSLTDAVTVDELQPNARTALPVTSIGPRAELQALTQQSAALRHQAKAARAAGRPQVALSGGYDRLQNRYLAKDDSWNIGIGMHWSLFDGAVSDNQADALAASADAVADMRTDLESRIALQVRAAELMVDESHSRIAVAETAIAQAEENLRVARDRYQSGVGTHTEVLDAETLRLKSGSNHFNAIYDELLAQQQLKRAHGAL